jgi:hypothetical protein
MKNINCNGSCSLIAEDGYRGSLDYFSSKYSITIYQNRKLREKLNREITTCCYSNESLVFEIKGDEIFKKAFDFFGSNIKQLSLLDFM